MSLRIAGFKNHTYKSTVCKRHESHATVSSLATIALGTANLAQAAASVQWLLVQKCSSARHAGTPAASTHHYCGNCSEQKGGSDISALQRLPCSATCDDIYEPDAGAMHLVSSCVEGVVCGPVQIYERPPGKLQRGSEVPGRLLRAESRLDTACWPTKLPVHNIQLCNPAQPKTQTSAARLHRWTLHAARHAVAGHLQCGVWHLLQAGQV